MRAGVGGASSSEEGGYPTLRRDTFNPRSPRGAFRTAVTSGQERGHGKREGKGNDQLDLGHDRIAIASALEPPTGVC